MNMNEYEWILMDMNEYEWISMDIYGTRFFAIDGMGLREKKLAFVSPRFDGWSWLPRFIHGWIPWFDGSCC